MSSSTFIQRWTSVNDLATTTNSNNNKQSTTFFLRPQFVPPPPPPSHHPPTSSTSLTSSSASAFFLRPSQSLISLVEPSSLPSKFRCQLSKTQASSSRVANIIHQFESQTRCSSMSNSSTKVSSPIRSVFVKQWEETRKNTINPRTPPIVILDTSSSSSYSSCASPIPFNSKKTNNQAEPIIICERITNHNRPIIPPPVSPKSPLAKTWSHLKLVAQQHIETIESDSDSAIHTLVTVLENSNNDCVTLSRSSTSATTDSTCSSTCSSTSPPRFARPTIASTQKQRHLISNSNSFKRTNSPPSPISTFTRTVSSPFSPAILPLFSINEDLEQQPSQSSTLATCYCSSDIDTVDEFCQLSTSEIILSDTTLSQNSITINTNLPLRYKRDSFIRLYGPDVMQQHGHHIAHDVVLEDDIDPPFSPRAVTVKKNKLITEEYELMEILGRGKFGEVKKCREKSTQHLLAAKFIQINKEQDRIEALNEIEIMKALQHPRLLQLYDAFETKGNFCLVMELINGGELFERVIDDDFILTERLCELYMMQICEGVSFMHSCNIIHLDMKPENILCVNRDGHRIKIIDFGLARKFDPTKQLKVLFGTPEFVAPEVINFDRVGFGTDMWSVGVICYVLLSGLSPFMGENDNDTYANINRANYDFDDEAFTDISDEAKDFISKLLVKDKDKRLPSRQCLTHPWLTRRPKLVSTPSDEESAEKKLSTKKLRRFVIRRRWQKAVNALLALQRMGMTL
ncbi:unnamed protein product [Adineta steineri]|uniref:Protein kinase domain-containing protein n=1 Tax=Adineta steineri TaxID=433720 RepID=A0A813SXM8_9BILA|nr:unnamed protein product [Adineta steineri]CAF3719803.1 unnamed protein product [Adineta steineri]